MPRQILRIKTMHHHRDRHTILALLTTLPGVTMVNINLAEHLVFIEHSKATRLATILDALRQVGYEASVLV